MVKILYFSRGHGFGHASKDVRIIRALKELDIEIQITAVSSGLGAAYFRQMQMSMDCIELDIPDENDQGVEAYTELERFLRGHCERDGVPNMIVSNEVFHIPLLARSMGIPTVLLTHWLFSSISNPGPFTIQSRRTLPDHDAVLADTVEAAGWHLANYEEVTAAVRSSVV